MMMKGQLSKPRKRFGGKVARFFQLDGTILSSHRTDGGAPTSSVDIADAILTGNEQNLEIVVEIPDRKTVVVYANDQEGFKRWMYALETAVARKFDMYYETGAFVGQGSVSVVKVVRNKITGENFAAKFVDKRRSGSRFGEDELKSLRGIVHPNIVRTHDVFENETQFILVGEYVKAGLLYDVLASQLPSEKAISSCVKQILTAVYHLHMNGVVHKNLKPENILVDREYQPFKVKVSDYGIRNWYRVDKDGADAEVKAIGEDIYVAPEIMAQRNFSEKIDSWSIGVIAYHLLLGHSPLTKTIPRTLDFKAPGFANVSDSAVLFLRGTLEVDDRKRLSIAEALQTPWITEGDQLSSRAVGNKLQGLSSAQRKVSKKLNLRDERDDNAGYQTTGSFQRNTMDVLTYGSRSVTDPGAYSINRDPWGGKAPARNAKVLRESKNLGSNRNPFGTESSSRSQSVLEQDSPRNSRKLRNSSLRNSRGMFKGRRQDKKF